MRKSKVFKFFCILSVLLFVAVFSKTGMAQLRGPDRKLQGMNEPENKGNVQFLLNIK